MYGKLRPLLQPSSYKTIRAPVFSSCALPFLRVLTASSDLFHTISFFNGRAAPNMSSTTTKPTNGIVPFQDVPFYLRIASPIRVLYVMLFKENLVLWSLLLQGRRNARADMEGPYYVIGAPERGLEEGKVLLASYDDLKQSVPYLLDLTIVTPKGDPVPYASIDWWQADSHGVYSASSYRLRGKFRTDANGKVQILTVAPGKYGPKNHVRAGHFHFFVGGKTFEGGKEKEWETLTTQVYVCKDNDANEMGTDFLNFVRTTRPANMVYSYTVTPPSDTSDTELYMSLPVLPDSETDTVSAVKWWNNKLQSITGDGEIKVFGCGTTEIRLNEKTWL